MMQESTVTRASGLPSSSRRCLWQMNVFCLIVMVFCALLCLALCLPCAGKGCLLPCGDGIEVPLTHDRSGSYRDVSSSADVLGSSPACVGLRDVCAGSNSFCFPSTLMGFLIEDYSCQAPSLEVSADLVRTGEISSSLHPGKTAFKLLNGQIVSCSLVESTSKIHDGMHSENKNVDGDRTASCKGPFVPDVWVQTSSGKTEHSNEIEPGFINHSTSPQVKISPPLLDWGINNLYSPSLAFLTVANTYNDSVLHVYEPFSTNPQFYAYDFDKLSLAPGEAASIAFVFLPRWLGSTAAHLVLQTSFGGFIIHAKGIAVESPYGIEPLVGFDISPDGRLSGNLSLFNPSNDVLYLEEVTAWVSVSSENKTHSAHVVCSTHEFHQPSEDFNFFLNDKEWFTVKSGELGLPWVEIRPDRQWEVPPLRAETVLVMNLWPHMEGKVFGAVCMKLRNSTRDWTDKIIVPLEVEVHGRGTYNALTGSFSVFFESLVPCDGRESIFSLSLRNDASYLLNVVKISEVTESLKVFQVKYAEGLLLYPGTVTQIALISYTPVDLLSVPLEIRSVGLHCMLSIETNDSSSPLIEIPCQDLLHTCSRHQPRSDSVASEGSYIGLGFQQEKQKSTNARTGALGRIIEEPLPRKSKILETEADELILRNWRAQGTMREISVLEDHELLFPVVQIGTHSSKWITVHNPSHKPVVMQLMLNSGAIIDQCLSPDDLSMHYFLTEFAHPDSIQTQDGFSMAESAITEAFVNPLGSALFGPVVFHPSNRCTWRSSALIRNNLSGVEWLPLRGFGGSHSLILLEGSEPIQKLEFNLDLPMNLNTSSPDLSYRMETTRAPCAHLLSKELYAKNTGELPLEVIKLDVSGSDCGLDGFMIHTCKGFALAPGESIRLLISYQADFSAAVVHRDLELAMATGILVIPMKASLPIHMLNVCRKSFFWKVLWKLFVLLFAAVSVVFLVFFCILPHSFSSGTEDYFREVQNTIFSISTAVKASHHHRNTRNARSVMEDEKPDAGSIGRCSHCPNGVQDNTQRVQSKQEPDHQKKTSLSSPSSTIKPEGVLESSHTSEAPQSGNLTIRTVRERGRRRKRRGLATTKFEVSSSQSGNSTPSSPVSPNASTPKQMWPLSLDTSDNPFSRALERNYEKKQVFTVSTEATVPEPEFSIKCCNNTWLPFPQDQPHVPVKSTGRPTLLPCATFPGTGWRTPGVTTPNVLASSSPIAPHARAPGSKLSKEETVKREEDDVLGKEFTYDIWGNHFSDKLVCRPKEFSSKVSDASEGDSQSFFVRDPQSLMMMSSARSVSPGHKLP